MGRGLDKPGMGGSGKCEPRGAKGLQVPLPKLDQGKVVEGSNCWWPLAGGVGWVLTMEEDFLYKILLFIFSTKFFSPLVPR